MHIDDRGRTIRQGQEALDDMVRFLENRKLHYRTTFQEIPISVENRKGSIRRGTDPDGKEWETKHKRPYGYIPGTRGVDGDALDVFVGPEEDAAFAYVIHINDPETGDYDEDKVMLGFPDEEAALKCFRDHYDDPHKFYSGMNVIPMWKFRKMAFVKKLTSRKLVASKYGAQAHIFTSMRRALLGRNIMSDPRVREHGVHGMKWGSRHEPKKDPDVQKMADHLGLEYRGEQEIGNTGKTHMFQDPRTGSSFVSDANSKQELEKDQVAHRRTWGVQDDSPLDIMDKYAKSDKSESREAQEFGVKGMKWGVRHKRKDAAGQKHGNGRVAHIHNRDLANDPKTMSMMQYVKPAQDTINKVAAQQQAQQSPQPKSPQEQKQQTSQAHEQVKQALKSLGWKALTAAAGMTGMGGILQGLSSMMQAPTGQRMFLHTSTNGQHTISQDRQGQKPVGGEKGVHRDKQGRAYTYTPRSRVYTSRRDRISQFGESKRGIYYARPMRRYGTDAEEADIDLLNEAFPDTPVNFAKTKRHSELGMGHFHEKVDRNRMVVVKPVRKNRLTAGVWSEARHALKRKKPVFAIFKGKVREVKAVKLLRKKNKEGEYGRIVLKQ